MATVRNALVVGAGIGGLSVAIALRRIGVAVEVIEAQAQMTAFGVGIIQPSNALRALDRLGVAEACIAAGGGFPGWRMYDGDGAMFAEVPNANVARPGMPAVNGLPRLALHGILVEAAEQAGAELRYGATLRDLDVAADGVRVGFEDGRTAKYDLLVGADGCYSKTRTALFGREFHPRFTGQGVWRCNLPRPAGMEWGGVFYGRHSKVGLVPTGPECMYMFVVTAEPGNPRFRPDELAAVTRDRLAEYGGLIGQLREQVVDNGAVNYKPLETLLLPPPWGHGRAIMIGDAVHATTPHLAQGASLAIEDAVVLADTLEAEDRPVAASLDAFTRRRFPRARLVVESSEQLGAWELAEWSGCPDPAASFGGLFHEVTQVMMQPA